MNLYCIIFLFVSSILFHTILLELSNDELYNKLKMA
jgi:hypothetical protein